MKKIITKAEQDKKTKRNQIIAGVVLIGLMLLSTAGYALSSKGETGSGTASQTTVNYNGVDFVNNDGYWQFNIGNYQYVTNFLPNETSEIKSSFSLSLNDLQNQPLYFAGNNTEAISEIARNLNNQVLREQNACLPKENCTGNFPVKDCSSDYVIYIREPMNENPSIYQLNKCIYIVANSSDQLKYSDAFLFKILKI